jgi:hypothetical protein
MTGILSPDAVSMLALSRMLGVIYNDHDHNKQPRDDGQDLVPEETLLGHRLALGEGVVWRNSHISWDGEEGKRITRTIAESHGGSCDDTGSIATLDG